MTTYELPEGMTAERLREMAKSFDFFAPGSIGSDLRAWADAIDPPKPEPAVSPPPPSLAVGEKVDCPTCGMSWIQCCEHRSKGLDNCCMACDEVGQRRNHTPQEGDGDDAELDALCTDIALEVVKRERDRWQKDCLVAEANEHRLAERLAMAEGLLRRVTIEAMAWESTGGVPVNGGGWWVGSKDWPNESHKVNATADEVAYLRSLDGEGDTDA